MCASIKAFNLGVVQGTEPVLSENPGLEQPLFNKAGFPDPSWRGQAQLIKATACAVLEWKQPGQESQQKQGVWNKLSVISEVQVRAKTSSLFQQSSSCLPDMEAADALGLQCHQ